DDEENWTAEEFDRHIVRERDGRRPLLARKVQVSLKKGLATFNDLKFTDNSSWIRSKKFCLGVKIAPGYCEGIHIREAKTEAFNVRDHRGERELHAKQETCCSHKSRKDLCSDWE
ncbi:hypothetical protein Droror1_Dr00008563, partial [Drosera rotundifolia]